MIALQTLFSHVFISSHGFVFVMKAHHLFETFFFLLRYFEQLFLLFGSLFFVIQISSRVSVIFAVA